MRHIFPIVLAFVFTSNAAIAAPTLIVTCQPAKGVNLSLMPAGFGVPEHFDPEASAYLSHPLHTDGFTITVNRDGTATDSSLLSNGTSIVSKMRIVGKMGEGLLSFTEGNNGSVNLVTLYQKESVVVISTTGYFGRSNATPIGSVYISQCRFSNVKNVP